MFFSDESHFQLYHADGRVRVWCRVGFCLGQCTRLHFINGNLNAQRYRDEILKPIVAPFVELHHVTFQQDNARPHMARICRDFLEEEDIPVLNWLPYSPDMSPSKNLWDVLDGHDLGVHRHLMDLGSLDDEDPNILLAIQLSLQESGMPGGGTSDESHDTLLGAIGTSLPSHLEQSPAGVEVLPRASLSSSELLELGDSLSRLSISSHYTTTGHTYRTSLPIPMAPGGNNSSTGLFSSSDTLDSNTCSSQEPSSSSALAANTNLLGNIMAWFHDMNPQGITLVPPTSSDTDTNLCALHTEDENESFEDQQDKSVLVVSENKKEVEADMSVSGAEQKEGAIAVAERPNQLDLVQLEPLSCPDPLPPSTEPTDSEAWKLCHVETPHCDSVSDQLPSTSSSEWEEQVHLV
ncbi:hypothetical protein WMY93_026792 [Mugilogobius chulae]|uniref:Tc1-like transposase DDE domain-containing protein n=1 Tax=Mugilogobius chulae TaxID=88201 RepID=A0AAW0N8U3_9GOBI